MGYFYSSRNYMTPEELEARRMKASDLFRKGTAQAEVAKRLKVTRTAAHYWHKAWEKEGKEALLKQNVGPKGKLTKESIAKVEWALLRGPEAYGYHTNLWTISRITAVVKKTTGAAYRDRSVWHVLLRMGWSSQKPERRAKERDEKSIARWKKTEWPSLQKKGFARV